MIVLLAKMRRHEAASDTDFVQGAKGMRIPVPYRLFFPTAMIYSEN